MKKTFAKVLVIGFFWLAALTTGSSMCLADTITSGSNGQINWIQTQKFSLDESFPTICYSDTVEGCSHQTSQQTTFTQTNTLPFHGAPSGFTIGDTQYALTGASLNFSYWVGVWGVVGCSDDRLGAGCSAHGSINSYGFADFPAAYPWFARKVYDIHTNDGWAHDDGWGGFIPVPNYASGVDDLYTSLNSGGPTVQSQSVTLDFGYLLSYFMGETTVDLELEKEVVGNVWGVDSDDNWDILRDGGAYYSNTGPLFDRWDGVASLQYTYSPVESTPVASTPEPSTLAMLGLGAAGLFALRRKERAAVDQPAAA